ncbi:MAG: alcohol dehydrogenase catalytic domain-containing protein, partial [Kofleriaceae bacterium]
MTMRAIYDASMQTQPSIPVTIAAVMSSTRKIVVHAAGGYDRLKLKTCPLSIPKRGEVRIDVRAIGVNYADTIVRMGLYASAKEYVGWPITPGFEIAGVIGAIGDGVTDLAVGAEVFAVTLFGGYSSHVVVDRARVFATPPSMSFEQAAALPAVYMT